MKLVVMVSWCLYFAAEELAENSNVQDAFVIAVEQQARERLEKLSALRKIKPVDMTTLSQQVASLNSIVHFPIVLMGHWGKTKCFIFIISEFQLCDSEPGPQQQEGEVAAATDSHISQAQDSKPGANGSKSVYSAPLSQIGSSTNLQNGELL